MREATLYDADLRLFDAGAEGQGGAADGEPGAAQAPEGEAGTTAGTAARRPQGEAEAAPGEDGPRRDPGPPEPPEPDDPAVRYALRREREARGFAAAQSARWYAQAAALHAREPDFDLDAMRGDPIFALLLTHGVPMEQAWRAATVNERVTQAAAAAEKAVTDHIRARGTRPAEAGIGGLSACDLRPDVARLSDGEILDVLARLARHERVSFG